MSKQEPSLLIDPYGEAMQDASAAKFVLKRIEPEGNRLIRSRELVKVTERFVNVELNYQDLMEIKAAIEAHYARQNLVAVVLIPTQDLREEVLKIELVESELTDRELYRALSQVSARQVHVQVR